MQRPGFGGAFAAAYLLGVALLPCIVDATLLGKERDVVHRIEKLHVTTLDTLQKREERCPTGNYLCAASLGGACCPDNYACATDHCFATTAGGGRTCNRKTGWYPCGPTAGGGCCPEGYVCQNNGQCGTPPGATGGLPCPNNYFSCPASLGGGCCRNGLGCGVNQCIATTPQVFTWTQTTVITTDNSRTIRSTITTTSTSMPSEPTGLPDETHGFPKMFVTALDKVQPTTVTDGGSGGGGSGGGLTSAQIGGIAGGVGALLIVVVVATFFIMRRLKQTQRVVDESRRGSSSATRTNRSHKHMTQSTLGAAVAGYPRPTASQVDAMEYDDLLQQNGHPSAQTPMNGGAASTIGGRVSSELAPSSRPTPNPEGGRQTSVDYFDLPRSGRHSAQLSTNGGGGVRSSMDSQSTAVTGAAEMMGSPPMPLTAAAIAAQQRLQQQQDKARRHHSSSNVSVTSWGSHELAAGERPLGSPRLPAELGDAAQVSELPVETASSELAGSMPARRRSTNGGSGAGGAGAGATSASASGANPVVSRPAAAYQRATGVTAPHAPNLDVVDESAGEIPGAEIHGYYGPPDTMAGQTDAGLDLNPPVATHLPGQQQPPPTAGSPGSPNQRQP